MNTPLPPDFAAADCLRCAQASADAYTLAGASGIPQFLVSDDATDTQGLIRLCPDAVIIALRGTTNLRDWITDCEIFKAAGVHYGFHQAALGIKDQIIQGLAGIGNRPILVTGHSLGGALAMLIAEELDLKGHEIRAVYTFGQPRVYDRQRRGQYNAELGDRTFRTVNQHDPVPWLPGVLIGYRHAGHELLWHNQTLAVDPPIWSKLGQTFAELIVQFRSHTVPANLALALEDAREAIGDHSMAAAYLAIASQLSQPVSGFGGILRSVSTGWDSKCPNAIGAGTDLTARACPPQIQK